MNNKNINLLIQLTTREIQGRYQGSILGRFWLILQPLISLAIYTFVFGAVLISRWPGGNQENLGNFAATLMAGLIPFNFWAESIQKAPGLVIQNPNYVTKVVFPLETLSISSIFSALFNSIISFIVLLVFILTLEGSLYPSSLAVPLLMLPLAVFCLAASWILSALGVYLRDIQQLISILITGAMFLSPVFYPSSSLPEWAIDYFQLNPLVFYIESIRNALIFGSWPNWNILLLNIIGSCLALFIAKRAFMHLSKGFSDVI